LAKPVVTLEECLITSIKKEAMLSALDSEPYFSKFFVTHLLSRNARLEEDLMDQLLHSSERRLARLLLVLATSYQANSGQDGRRPVAVTLSQAVLVEMIGTTRSRVNAFMNKFRENGFISYDSHNGGIEVQVTPLLSKLGS
jgi:CRP/FNR family transcriptional regulator, cyclic AMP receptor protein